MIRTFSEHKIRYQHELSQRWKFTADEKALSVLVPSCWETYPGYEEYRGSASYETTFEAAGNVRVICKGVSHTADVFVDGEKSAHHYNAYTPFDFVLKDVAQGMHTIAIEVSNAFDENSALHVPNDYYTYGGITRPVVIEKLPDTYIEQMHVTPIMTNGKWEAEVECCVVSKRKQLNTFNMADTQHLQGYQPTRRASASA